MSLCASNQSVAANSRCESREMSKRKRPASKINRLLLLCEKVEEQRAQTGTVQHSGDEGIAWTKPAAAAPMREEHYTVRLGRQREVAVQHHVAGREANFD